MDLRLSAPLRRRGLVHHCSKNRLRLSDYGSHRTITSGDFRGFQRQFHRFRGRQVEMLRGEPTGSESIETPHYPLAAVKPQHRFPRDQSASITCLSLSRTVSATPASSGLLTACIEAAGSTAATSTPPSSVAWTTTLQGNIVPILSSASSA